MIMNNISKLKHNDITQNKLLLLKEEGFLEYLNRTITYEKIL